MTALLFPSCLPLYLALVCFTFCSGLFHYDLLQEIFPFSESFVHSATPSPSPAPCTSAPLTRNEIIFLSIVSALELKTIFSWQLQKVAVCWQVL